METNEVSRSASGLHMISSMKRVAVGILALVVASGCGVGADESYDGQGQVSSSSQALEQAQHPGPEVPGAVQPQTPGTPAPGPLHDPSTVALPQDPIPVFEGRPGPKGAPLIDPTWDPLRGPVPPR